MGVSVSTGSAHTGFVMNPEGDYCLGIQVGLAMVTVIKDDDHPKRQERITVMTNGRMIDTPTDRGILSMGASLKPLNMYLLEGLLAADMCADRNADDPHISRLGFVRFLSYTEGFDDAFSAQLDDALRNAPRPSQIDFKVLKDTHWFLVVLSLQQDGRVTLDVCNTTNETGHIVLEDIKADYQRVLFNAVHRCFLKSATSKGPFNAPSQMNYSQYLQYGQMGCGFATALNADAFARGELDLNEIAFKEEDQKFKDTVREEVRLDTGEVVIPRRITKNIDKERSYDRSLRHTLEGEAKIRARLCLDLARRHELKHELARYLACH